MPDLDIVSRTLKKPWRSPYKLLKGGHPAEMVAASLISALAATLREEGGLPDFGTLLANTRGTPPERRSAQTLAEASRALEQKFGQQQAAKLLARSVLRNSAQVEAGMALPGPLPIIEEFLRSQVRANFLAKINGRLVGTLFLSSESLRIFEEAMWTQIEPGIIKLARSLMEDPTASKVRAPRSPRRRHSTAELLDLPVSGEF